MLRRKTIRLGAAVISILMVKLIIQHPICLSRICDDLGELDRENAASCERGKDRAGTDGRDDQGAKYLRGEGRSEACGVDRAKDARRRRRLELDFDRENVILYAEPRADDERPAAKCDDFGFRVGMHSEASAMGLTDLYLSSADRGRGAATLSSLTMADFPGRAMAANYVVTAQAHRRTNATRRPSRGMPESDASAMWLCARPVRRSGDFSARRWNSAGPRRPGFCDASFEPGVATRIQDIDIAALTRKPYRD